MRRLIHWMLPAMLLMWAAQAQAVLEVTVTEGVTGAIPVAVAPFTYEGEGELDEDISQIVAANLARSGLFNVEQDDLPSAPSGPADFLAEPWADTGVEYLVVGNQRRDGDDVLVEFHVFDVLSEERLGGWRIPVPGDMLRRGAHRISDIIYEQITGDPGAFSARIAFVSVERNGDERRFALEVADSDGANPRTLFRSAKPIMSPDWSPDGRELVYVSFENRRSEVYRQNVETGSRERVASFTGINSAPAWSPDGRYLALSLSRDGAPNIYLMELETGEMRQMTQTIAPG